MNGFLAERQKKGWVTADLFEEVKLSPRPQMTKQWVEAAILMELRMFRHAEHSNEFSERGKLSERF